MSRRVIGPTWPAASAAGAHVTARPRSSGGSRSSFASFFVGSFVIGAEAGNRRFGPRRIGPRARDSRRGLPAAGGRDRPDPERLAASERLRSSSPRRVRWSQRSGREAEVTNIRSPLDAENAGQISADGRSALVEFQIRGDADLAVDKIDPILLAIADAQAAHPEVFIGDVRRRKRRPGARGSLHGRPQEGRPLLGPDHADHPDRRLRRSRRGRDPAAARADGRPRDVRAVGDPEPDLAERRVAVRDGAPDRARRRSRLLDVLLEARARGARRRAEPRGGARDRRRDVRALGAHLRGDRHHRDGGHALRRRRPSRRSEWPR